ncbi:MAG TPA: FGLLP motif-containing membrane protein [Candidatus Limnocylindrales bacterium]|nr:FGLLP motif-containing membrane protein [Candidatus Limnocylindrales bacterium]
MRAATRISLGFTLLTALTAIVPAIVAAETVENLVARASNANSWAMTCTINADLASCSKTTRLGPWSMQVKPATGPIDSVITAAQKATLPLDTTAISWMTDMHQFACGDPKTWDAFVTQVGSFTKPGTEITQAIGTCSATGGLYGGSTAPTVYRVVSIQLPSPTAAPTATPGPTATPKPTAAPTRTPHPTATPAPTLLADASATPAPTATATPAPTTGASPSALPTPSAAVAGEQTAAPTPGPTGVGAGPADPTPEPTPTPTQPTFEQSVLGITDINTDTGAIGGSLLLALLMLLIIGFAGELFNNTVENNYSVIAGWLRKGPLGALRNLGGSFLGEARIGLVSFLLLTTLVSCFVDPHFGLDLRSLGEFAGFLVGLVIVLMSFKLPPMLAHRRRTGDLGRLRPLPWALVIAGVFVLISRIGNLQPGYLYGIVLGAIFVKEVTPREEGRETFFGSIWTLGAAVLGWIGLQWVHGLGLNPSDPLVTLVSTACAAVAVSGLEATAFGLMPMRFMPGYAVYRWNRVAWAVLWGVSLFGFLHILIAPTSGYVSQLSPQAFAAALGVFATFGAVSILVWGYFRLRPADASIRFD